MNDNAPCGTVCCAIGEATFIPSLRKAGLSMIRDRWGFSPVYKDYKDWDAVEKFFGLSERHAEYLFMDCSYMDNTDTQPSTVAARIRELLASTSSDAGVKDA